jgi:heme exporter protein A
VKLIADNLSVRRGERLIFTDLSFGLKAGEALVVRGRNGAGKSSLLAVLAGLLRPEAGNVSLDGDPEAVPSEAMNFVGHRDGLKAALTAEENLAFGQAVLGVAGRRPRAALEALGIGALAQIPVAYLSAGQRRRVGLARLLVSARPIWLLDEPTAALDAASQETLGALMAAHLASGGLVVATTHGPLPLSGARELTLGADSAVPMLGERP